MFKANILLVNPPGWQNESINLGLSYLSGSLKQAGHETLILDINRCPLDDRELKAKVADYAPDVVGISVKTATARSSRRIAALLSPVCPEAVFVAGGPHVTLCADRFLTEAPVFDYGIMGEAEYHLVELISGLSGNLKVEGIEGLAYRAKGRVRINGWSPPENLDELPRPDLDAIDGFDWRDFRYPLITSRGCPFGCTYCCVNKLAGSKRWRFRSVRNVVDELESVHIHRHINTFEIWDDNFTLDIDRAKEICREIIHRGLDMSWYCHNGIRADRIDPELAVLMKKAGCTSIAFGIESGNPTVFASIQKGESLSAVVEAVQTVKAAGMKAVGYFIIGLPGDSLSGCIETVRFQRRLKLDHSVYGMLVPYPQTEVWDTITTRGRLLCDPTATRHFGNGMVPVSFEMPSFPRHDMVRAFYISKYYRLFEAAQSLVDAGQSPTVVYFSLPQKMDSIPGLIIACDPQTRHVIFDPKARKRLYRLKDFPQIPAGTRIEFDGLRLSDLSETTFIGVGHRAAIPAGVLFKNMNLILLNPERDQDPLTVFRKHIPVQRLVPGFIAAGVGHLPVLSAEIREYGARQTLAHLVDISFSRVRSGLHLPFGSVRRAARSAIRLVFVWHVIQLMRTRRRLRRMAPKKCKFPYENHSAYM